MLQHRTILELLMNPEEGDAQSMNNIINMMCTNSYGLTKEVASQLIRGAKRNSS